MLVPVRAALFGRIYRMNQRLNTSPDLHKKEPEGSIVHYSLPNLVQGSHRLILHKERRTLSLICETDGGPGLLQQEILSDNELQIIVPILNVFPHYCPYEVLLASIISRTTIQSTITNWRLRLLEAHHKGTWQQEIRPVRRTLSSLRRKLYSFGLEISTIREKGCSITSTVPC
jgi:hypothetical protein